jgi:hypothetical protein
MELWPPLLSQMPVRSEGTSAAFIPRGVSAEYVEENTCIDVQQ